MNKLVTWIKDNKLAAAAVAGGAFLFMAKKGNDSAVGGSGADAIEGSRVVTVPVATEDYDNEDVYDYRDQGDAADAYIEGLERGLDLGQDEDLEDEELAGEDEPEGPTKPIPAKMGITLHGKFFRGATGYTLSKVDKGGFLEYLIKYDGRNERWQFHAQHGWNETWKNPTASAKPPATEDVTTGSTKKEKPKKQRPARERENEKERDKGKTKGKDDPRKRAGSDRKDNDRDRDRKPRKKTTAKSTRRRRRKRKAA